MKRMNDIFDRSFEEFLSRDWSLVLSGTEERNLCGRLAACIEKMKDEVGLYDYWADTDYRYMKGRRVKTILYGEERVVEIGCDIILHSRGFFDRDNLIAIEMKSLLRPEQARELSRERLMTMTMVPNEEVRSADDLTLPEHVCGYELGVFIELEASRDQYRIEKFKEGQSISVSYGELSGIGRAFLKLTP